MLALSMEATWLSGGRAGGEIVGLQYRAKVCLDFCWWVKVGMTRYVLTGSPARVVESYKLNENMMNGGTCQIPGGCGHGA
jgi:hypothetical protein